MDWNSFSIARGERTIFRQPGDHSSAFNRVLLGARSMIAGELRANGQVILFNPAGVTVTSSGVVNVNSLVVSTLDLSDDEFLQGGAMTFRGDSAADVTNLGTIHARTGDVFLLGRKVVNAGTVEAPHGTVGLGAGTEIVLKPDADEPLYIKPRASAAQSSVEQTGVIRAAAAQIKATGNPYALAINLDGVLDVRGSAEHPGGRATVDAGAGRVRLGSQSRVSARASDGAGGRVAIRGDRVAIERGARVKATGSHGGEITAQAATDLSLGGELSARGSTAGGGTISLLGADLTLSGDARADASGQTGGGRIFVGGDYFGGRDPGRHYADAPIPTATSVKVAAGATLAVNALASGNGGVVIQWSDGVTESQGTVSVRGGAEGGNGGFAEISGRGGLGFNGRVDLAAPNGRAGEVLFDPDQLNISNYASGVGSIIENVSVQSLEAISSGTITLKASGYDNGIQGVAVVITDLTVNGDGKIDLQPNVSLSIIGDQYTIYFENPQNSIIARGTGSILLQAGTLNLTSHLESVGNLQTDLGSITLRGDDGVTLGGTIVTHGGSVDIDADWDQGGGGGFILPAGSSITTDGGDVHLKSGNGGITVNSPISLGAGRLTFSQTGGAAGTFRLGSVISVSGDLDVTQALEINPGAGLTASGAIHLGSTVKFNSSASLALRSQSLDLTGASFVSPEQADILLEPYDAAKDILLWGSDGVGGAYDVDPTLYTKLQVFRSLTIGRADGTGGISLAVPVPSNIPLTLKAGGVGGHLDLDHPLVGNTGAPIAISVGSDLTIKSGGGITSQATGNAVQLSAGRFINESGSAAVATPNGRWLIYSTSPDLDTFGNLASGQTALWGRTLAANPGDTITDTGNRYVFSNRPVLNFKADDSGKTYGDDVTGSFTASFLGGLVTNTYGGAIEPDTLANALSGSFALSSPGQAAAAGAGSYKVNLTQGTAHSDAGYDFGFSDGLLTVDPKAINLSVTSGGSVYGDAPLGTPTLLASGLVNGDSPTDLTGLSVDFAIDGRTGAGFHPVGLTGTLTNPNYTVASVVPGLWAVAPRPIAIDLKGGSSIYGNTPHGPTLIATGLVNGDTLANLPGVGSSFDLTRKSGAGTYALSVTGQSQNPNYFVLQRANGEWVIRPRPVTITALGGESRTGDKPSNPGLSATGLAEGDGVKDLTGLRNSFSVNDATAAGDYALFVAGMLNNPNYEVLGRIPGLWIVRLADITPEPINPVSPQPALPKVEPRNPSRSNETSSLEASASALANSAESASTQPGGNSPTTNQATRDALAGENTGSVIAGIPPPPTAETNPASEEASSEAPTNRVASETAAATEATRDVGGSIASADNAATSQAAAIGQENPAAANAAVANSSTANAPAATSGEAAVASNSGTNSETNSAATNSSAAAAAGSEASTGTGSGPVGNVGTAAGQTVGRSTALQSLGQPEPGSEPAEGNGGGLSRVAQSPEVQSVAPLGDFNTVFVMVLGIAIAQLASSAAGMAATGSGRAK